MKVDLNISLPLLVCALAFLPFYLFSNILNQFIHLLTFFNVVKYQFVTYNLLPLLECDSWHKWRPSFYELVEATPPLCEVVNSQRTCAREL